jgi:hypothetical protein
MLGMGSGNVNDVSDQEGSGQNSPQNPPAPRKPDGFAGVLFVVKNFFTKFSKINWSATAKALLASLTSKKAKKVKPTRPIASTSVKPVTEPEVRPGITVSSASEDADIEEWLNKITEKASRSTSSNSKAATQKAPAKKATVTKKAIAKSSAKRK